MNIRSLRRASSATLSGLCLARSRWTAGAALFSSLLVLAACARDVPDRRVDLEVRVQDVTGLPIAGALVVLTAPDLQRSGTTNALGSAQFLQLPVGSIEAAVSAQGFDPSASSNSFAPDLGPQGWTFTLNASDEWALARLITLDTEVRERADDGSAMTFSVDIAAVDRDAEALLTLTSADFALPGWNPEICGWLPPGECGSASHGVYPVGEGPYNFSLQPPADRHPYVAGVLIEVGTGDSSWPHIRSGLATFFDALGVNDAAGVAVVESLDGVSHLRTLGPFTSDGAALLDAIDGLSPLASSEAAPLDEFLDWIRLVASVDLIGASEVERTVVLIPASGRTESEIEAISALALELGVRVSILGASFYELPKLAARTSGFAAGVYDPRQLSMTFGAMDPMLAGTLPFYRMEFHVESASATFVSGGVARVELHAQVPSSIPNMGVATAFYVSIP